MSNTYCIIVKEQLDSRWSAMFDSFTVTGSDDGATVLTGSLTDQAALFGILSRIRDLNLTLLALTRIERLTESKGK